jgi:putative DNA primase/helicase
MNNALAALEAFPQFVLYRTQPSATRPGKTDKVPCTITGTPCDAHDPANWRDAMAARAAAASLGHGYGVGFVLTAADPFFCLDLDNCLLPDSSGWSPQALELVARFPGAACEVSQSARGLHIWGTYSGAAPAHSCRNAALGAELYTQLRFIALGHPGATGNAATDCTAALHLLVADLFPPTAAATASTPTTWTDYGTDTADDGALVARLMGMRSAAAAFGQRASFADLWNADEGALATAYPDTSGNRPYDASRADAALAQHLAWATGGDCERIKRMMLASGLRRDKYERDDYLVRTISAACARQTDYLQQPRGADTVAASAWQIAPFADDAAPDLSHDQIALDLSRAGWANDARFVPVWGCWLFFDGVRWVRDDKLHHMTAIRDFLRGKSAQLIQWAERRAATLPNPEDRDKLLAATRRKATELRQAANRAAIEQTARSNADLVATVEQFDADLDVLGVPSGAVDLRTGETLAPNRAAYITKAAAVDPAPAGTRAPLWEAFLHRIFAGDAELIAFVQRAAGYSLTGYTREQRLLFLYGNGANGKSVFLNTLQWLLHEYAKRAPADVFLESRNEQHPTSLAGLHGARLVVSSELPPGKSWNEAIIKDLTGGDVITARRMRQDFFEYVPQFALMVCGNHQPTFRGIDEAIRRRVLLVPFTVTIPKEERDHQLAEKLKAEGPAILRWCIAGAVEWYRQGLNPPASVEAASADYLDGEDMLGEFLADCTTRIPGAGERIAAIYQRFAMWSQQRGLHSPWSQHALTRALGERGLTIKRGNDGRYLMDHQLKGWAMPLAAATSGAQ